MERRIREVYTPPLIQLLLGKPLRSGGGVYLHRPDKVPGHNKAIAKMLWSAGAPGRLEWYFNNTRMRHRWPENGEGVSTDVCVS